MSVMQRQTRNKLILAGVVLSIFLAVSIVLIYQALFPQVSFEHAVGTKLPAGIRHFRSQTSTLLDGGEYFAAAEISESDFLLLMSALALQQNPPELRQYPRTLAPSTDLDWWMNFTAPPERTFFALRPDKTHDSFIAATFKDGRFYLRRSYW